MGSRGVVALQLRVVDLPTLLRFDADGRLIEVRAPLAPGRARGRGLRRRRRRRRRSPDGARSRPRLPPDVRVAWVEGSGVTDLQAALGRRLRPDRAARSPRARRWRRWTVRWRRRASPGRLARDLGASYRAEERRGYMPRGRSWQRACEIPGPSGEARSVGIRSQSAAAIWGSDRVCQASASSAITSGCGGGRGPSGRAAARRRPLDAGRGRRGWPRGSRDPVVARDRDLSGRRGTPLDTGTGGITQRRGIVVAAHEAVSICEVRRAEQVPGSCSPRCASASGRASGGRRERSAMDTAATRRARSRPPSRGRPRQVLGDAPRPRGRSESRVPAAAAAGPAAGRPRRPLVVAARPWGPLHTGAGRARSSHTTTR